MFDFHADAIDLDDNIDLAPVTAQLPGKLRLPLAKLVFDRCLATLLLLPLGFITALLFLLNPFLNSGSLFFVQDRMGYGCRPFTAVKFRTMTGVSGATRGAFDALETNRITVLGRWLRKTRIDELPQIINVLRGEMSLIGPRPDSYDHARVYLREIPGYAHRHSVLPGISGYAQTEIGYVDGRAALLRKVAADRHYIAHASFRFDLWITWRTLVVILTRQGA